MIVDPQDIPGLLVLPGFISRGEEALLVHDLARDEPPPESNDAHEEGEHGRDRIRRYGTPEALEASGYTLGECRRVIPVHLSRLCDRIYAQQLVWQVPNSVSVNDYLIGQGLELHVDHPGAGAVVSSLGVLGAGEMMFRFGTEGQIKIVKVPRRALVQLRDPCRSEPWFHGIAPVKQDRISIVFRYGDVH